MNFDTSVHQAATTNLDRFDVGRVYRDDAEKLHSDLIGINAISLEELAMELSSNNGEQEQKVMDYKCQEGCIDNTSQVI